MNKEQIIKNTILFVKNTLAEAEGGHDWFHIERVYKTAKNIASKEKADLFTVELGALLHDIADSKFYDGDEEIGPKTAAEFLKSQNVSEEIISHIVQIIKNISFKGGNFKQTFSSIELDCIQDADRLDAIGAIGIARCFSYGGCKNRALYNPDISPNLNMSKEEYKNTTAPSINHFYEKLLLLKDKMNTITGKNIALQRHDFMQMYLKQFYKEWEGNL
ncbi:HD domain-containing protein [Bacteroidota bacterium]